MNGWPRPVCATRWPAACYLFDSIAVVPVTTCPAERLYSSGKGCGIRTAPERAKGQGMQAVATRRASTLSYKWQAAIIVGLGLFLSVLDNTIVSVALPAMRQAFNTDFDTITWVVTAYFLAQAAVIPVTGISATAWAPSWSSWRRWRSLCWARPAACWRRAKKR